MTPNDQDTSNGMFLTALIIIAVWGLLKLGGCA